MVSEGAVILSEREESYSEKILHVVQDDGKRANEVCVSFLARFTWLRCVSADGFPPRYAGSICLSSGNRPRDGRPQNTDADAESTR
jgi:hypothetical protein